MVLREQIVVQHHQDPVGDFHFGHEDLGVVRFQFAFFGGSDGDGFAGERSEGVGVGGEIGEVDFGAEDDVVEEEFLDEVGLVEDVVVAGFCRVFRRQNCEGFV